MSNKSWEVQAAACNSAGWSEKSDVVQIFEVGDNDCRI